MYLIRKHTGAAPTARSAATSAACTTRPSISAEKKVLWAGSATSSARASTGLRRPLADVLAALDVLGVVPLSPGPHAGSVSAGWTQPSTSPRPPVDTADPFEDHLLKRFGMSGRAADATPSATRPRVSSSAAAGLPGPAQ